MAVGERMYGSLLRIVWMRCVEWACGICRERRRVWLLLGVRELRIGMVWIWPLDGSVHERGGRLAVHEVDDGDGACLGSDETP